MFWSETKFVFFKWCALLVGWSSSFASFTIQCPARNRCSLLRSFADWTNGTRLPCVHSLSNSARQGSVCNHIWCFPCFPARAAWRGALAISDMSHNNCDGMESSWDLCPLIWRIQKRRQRCRRRLLKSAPSQCESACTWAFAFARLPLHSSPLLGGLKSRGLLAPASRWTGSCHYGANDGSCFDVNPELCSKKIVRLAFFLFVRVLWSGNACRRNT